MTNKQALFVSDSLTDEITNLKQFLADFESSDAKCDFNKVWSRIEFIDDIKRVIDSQLS